MSVVFPNFRHCFLVGIVPFEIKIGLELHIKLDSGYKLFSGQTNEVSVIDEGLPGSLPVLNIENLHILALLASLFNVIPNPWLSFTRKSYFYVDLPLGYQITQKFYPVINSTGISMISFKINKYCIYWAVLIRNVCLEHDSGTITRNKDCVGFYRSGRSLIEFVTYPCFDGIVGVKLFILKLRLIFIYSGISSCNMDDSGFRFDVNASLTTPFTIPTTKTEFKNINSLAMLDGLRAFLARRKG